MSGEQLAANVEKNTILVRVSMHKMGISRKVKQQTREEYAASTATDPRMLRASKDLVDSKEYEAIVKRDGEFYRAVMDRVLPSQFQKGTYLLPLRLLDWFEGYYADYERERTELVEKFLDVYEQRIFEARELLGENYDPNDYPSVGRARDAFYLEKQYVVQGTPDKLKQINPALYGKERERLRREMESAAGEVRLALRRGLLELVDRLQARLEPDVEGKKKSLRATTVENLSEWLELFSARNVTNDAELQALSEKLKAVMVGADRDMLRDNERVRNAVAEGLKSASAKLSGMVQEGPKRKFRLAD